MTLLIVALGLAALYFLLLFFVPKGNLLNEILALSQYWFRIILLHTKGLRVRRFKYGPHRRQYFLLYQSMEESPSLKHLIVYFHGGAWGFGSPESFRSNAQILVDQGYDVIMPSYRRIPWYDFRNIREDITLSMKKIKAIYSELGFDNDKKIILGGMSAGGHLAALILYDLEQLSLTGFTPNDFAGIFSLAGPLQLSSMDRTPILWFLAGDRNGELFAKANPYNYIQEGQNTPLLIIHGDKDGIVTYPAAADFYAKMENVNPGVSHMCTLENGSHLDVAKWVYENDKPQEWLLDWLKRLE